MNKTNELQTIKVLIVDDDSPTRILLRAAISQWGYEVIEAKDGEEAWEILQQPNVPQLLLLDWLMPKLDGIALCNRIKQQLNYHPYIIFLTELTGEANIVKGLEAGANEFLSKPFNMLELKSRISTGKKMIHYENELKNQNQQLQQYIKNIKSIIPLLSDMTIQIDNMLKKSSSNKSIKNYENSLESIQKNLKNIVNIITTT